MRKATIFLISVVISVIFAEYPSGYFYAIFRNDTFCVKPVITDSTTEAAWFDYTSASMHTGFETAYESHFFFFYNPMTGNIGFVIQHNIDETGTADATCILYLDDIPPACSLAMSDDAGEFDLTAYPQGNWHWWVNTDGGAFYIPRDEWQFTLRATYGSTDPIRSIWFISDDDGSDRIRLDTVYVGQEDTLIVGHGFLQLLTFVDSLDFDSVNVHTTDTLHYPVCNSDETSDTLIITSITLNHPEAYSIVYYPTELAPGDCDDIIVTFHPSDTGYFYDTLEIDKLIPCDSTTYVPIFGRSIQPRIDSVWFSEETDCDGQNIVEICYDFYGDAEVANSVQAFFSHESLGGEWFNFSEFAVDDTTGDLGDSVYPGVHCFNWNLGEDIPGFEQDSFAVKIGFSTILDTFIIVDSIDISSRSRYGHGLAYGDSFFWIYDNNAQKIYKAECLDFSTCPPIDSFYVGRFNCDIDYYDGYVYYSTNNSSSVADDTIKRINVEDGSREVVFVFPTATDIEGLQVTGGFLYISLHSSTDWNLCELDLSTLPATSVDTIIHSNRDTCFALMEGLANAMGYLWGCNNDGYIGQIDLGTDSAVGCHPVPNIGYGAEGLCWDGEYLWYQNNQTEWIYKIMITDTASNWTMVSNPVDSKSPDVSLNCPADTIFYGDTITFLWNVFDMFPNADEQCSVFVHYCDGVDTFLADDSIMWTPPMVVCDSAYIAVSAPDSFCNWGNDSCGFRIIAAGSLVVVFPETSAYACDTIDVPITARDILLPIMSEFDIWFRVNSSIATVLGFTSTVEPAADSIYFDGSEDNWLIKFLWDSRNILENDTLGYLQLAISCGANGGDITPLYIDSVKSDIIDTYWDNGYVVVNYNPAQWLEVLHLDDTTGQKDRMDLAFGNAHEASENYDASYDIIYVSPPLSGVDAWLKLDDLEHPAINRLSRDVRDMIPINTWQVVINEDMGLYVHWDTRTFDEGLYILNGYQDMRVDTDYYAVPYETLTITWSLPELELNSIHLYPGWNLVSIPFYNPSAGASSIFPWAIAGPLGYDASSGSYYYAESIQPGAGYWVFSLSDMDIPMVGEPISRYVFPVQRGWNLVGATIDSIPVDTVSISPSGSVISLFEFDATTRNYLPSSVLAPCKGYWIFIDNSGYLWVPGE